MFKNIKRDRGGGGEGGGEPRIDYIYTNLELPPPSLNHVYRFMMLFKLTPFT
jgi:hypothetical protein